MAITATFSADFTSFNNALKNASTNLKSFEVATKNVAQQLNRAFSTFSGEKLIRDANLAAAAVTKLGGVTKLTAAEQARLNATVTEALAKYKALGQSAPADLHKIDAELKQLAASQKSVATATTGAAASFGTQVAAYAAGLATFSAAKSVITGTVGAIIDFGKASVTAFANAEAAQKKMVVALRAQGTATPEVIRQYNALASTIQKTTAFSDDAASEMQALFITIGNVGPAQMEKATTAATDLAAGLGLDLTQAATLVSKAIAGNTGALSRYGIKLDEARVAAEGADYIFGQIAAKFGGQAAAQLETYSGQVAQLANDWDNVQEAVGKMLVTNELTVLALRAIREEMTAASGATEDFTTSVGAWLQLLGADPTLSTYVALLEDYVSLLNEASRTTRGAVPGTPPPLPLPTAPGLPRIDASQVVEEWDKARAAADALTKAVQNLRDEISGAAAIAELRRLGAAWNGLTDEQREATATIDATATKYLRLLPALGKVPPALHKTVTEMNRVAITSGQMNQAVTKGVKSLDGLGVELGTVDGKASDAFHSLLAFESAATSAGEAVRGLGRALDDETRFIDTAIDLQDRLTVAMARGNDRRVAELQIAKRKELEVLRAAFGAGTAEYLKFEAIVEEIYRQIATEDTIAFGQALRRNLEQAVGGIANILADAVATGNWADVAADIGATIGGAIGAAIGFAVAGPVGAAVGEAFGKLLGPLLDKIIETRAEETQKRVATEFGVGISEGLAQAIEDASKDFGGNRQAAKLFNLDRIIEEGGGLSSANIDKMLANLRNVFVMIETGAFTTEQAMQVLDKNFADFAAFVTRDGALASEALLEIIELNERFGTSSKEVAEFVTAQLTGAIGGLTTFLENAEVTSQAAADGIAASVFGIFEELVKQGATPLEAIKQITPVLEQLDAQLKAAGLSGGGAFEQIRNLAGIASDAVSGPMVEAITGLGVALEGLHNSGVLNQEMFAGLATQVTDTYNKLIAQGTDGAQALQLVGPTLQTLWELQQDFGYAVDDATQKLIDQGVAAGQVGDQHRSVQEQMAIAMERTADALEALLTGLGIELPNATQTAADASGRMSDQMVEDLSIWGEAGIQSAEDIQAKIDALNAGDVSSRLVEDMQTFGTRGEEAVAGIQPEIDSLTFGPVTEEMIEDIKEWARAAGYSAEEIQKFLDRIDPKIPVEFDVPPFPKLPKPPTVKIPTKYERPDGSAVGFAEGGVVPGYAKGGVVYAQQGMWLPRGTDTVPAMLTPGEVVLPRDVVAALRSSAPGSVTVNLTITALDGADVERVVRSPSFRRALTATVRGNDGGVRTDLRADLGVR